MEISYGRFERLVSLPPEVDITKASADYNNGYLEIRLPVKSQVEDQTDPHLPQGEDDKEGDQS